MKPKFILHLQDIFIWLLVILFLLNQLMITKISMAVGMRNGSTSKTIIAPKINPDGKTTTLIEWPTITEVSANPNSGNALSDAKVVMIATGKPFYAPDDIAFDDTAPAPAVF